ncbi:hypothetical protein EST38_g11168 [Candolleomyces aberdarensis]|uniref:Helicase ATP-binding domain-containing protein n=1 Tax=Candolleomyces aberdarensis TaxID=2316362 RepID=A0A4Q2D5I7_9AGAR|nr:hypothetical protein EST38_g11168 [Candolleomyces aberdarensis]
MPTHTSASALIKLYHSDGAPWSFPQWQTITGVTHGLMPPRNEHLPKELTRQDIIDIDSYFSQYAAKPTEDDKIKFASKAKKVGKDEIPGRGKWHGWVSKRFNKSWKVSTRIVKILASLGLHPEQIMDENDEATAPNSSSYLPLALDSVARELFGPEALDTNGRLLSKLREPTMVFAQLTWRTEVRSIPTRKKKLETIQQVASTMLSDLENGKISVKAIKSAIRAVANFEKAIATSSTAKKVASLQALKDGLEPFIPEMPTKSDVKVVKRPAAKRRVTVESLSKFATPEQVAELLELYDQYFGQEMASTDELETEDLQGVTFGEPVEGADPGVEIEAQMSSSELACNLGFQDNGNMPFLFNRIRHSGGLSAWSSDFEDAVRVQSDALESFSLQWHQLCGAHAVLRRVFSKTPDPSHCRGMLLADDVGLGKTIQASTVMAVLSELSVQHARSLAVPPLMRDTYLKGSKTVPSLPHLVVVPGTLIRQWEHEIQCFFKKGSVDIFIYGTRFADHEVFWSQDGVVYSSNQPPSHRIILTSQSALQQDFNSLYSYQSKLLDLPWDYPEPVFEYKRRLPSTLFGQNFLSVTIDEAQGVKNTGPKHTSALRILDQALVRIVLTATPLHTSTKDIASMGRLVGIPYFFTDMAYQDQVSDNSRLRRAKAERDEEGQGEENDVADPLKMAQVEISTRMSAYFDNRVIRRVADSKDYDGKKLISLPLLTVIHGALNLTEREKDLLEDITIDGLYEASDANGRNSATSRFYLDHRMGVTFAKEPDSPIPVFESLKQWSECLSTKIDTAARITIHVLTRDDMPLVYFEDGVCYYPSAPNIPVFTRHIKVLIYIEFPSYSTLVRNVFELYGIKILLISGTTSYEQRAKIVRKFNEDPEYRVLVFSKVGSTGLNLTRANFVLFLITGRAWRQRQTRPVTAIHLLANNTADITLSLLARGKKDMLDAFFTTDASKALMRVMVGDVIREDGDEDEETMKKKLKSKKGRGTGKGKGVSKKAQEEYKNSKGKRVKSKKIVIEEDEEVPLQLPSALALDEGTSTDTSMHTTVSDDERTDFSSYARSNSDRENSSISSILANGSSDEAMDVDSEPDSTILAGLTAQENNDSLTVNAVAGSAVEESIEEASGVDEDVAMDPLGLKRDREPVSPPPKAQLALSLFTPESQVTSPLERHREPISKKARFVSPARFESGDHTVVEDKSPLMQPMFPTFESMGIQCPPSPTPSRSRPPVFLRPADDPFVSQASGKSALTTNPFARKPSAMPVATQQDNRAGSPPPKKVQGLPKAFRGKRKMGLSATRPDDAPDKASSSSGPSRHGDAPSVTASGLGNIEAQSQQP